MRASLMLLLGPLALSGCVSSGRHDSTSALPAQKVVSVEALDPLFSPVVPMLESRGYSTTNSPGPETIICRTSCGGGFSMTVEISLWYHGKMFAEGKATNGGWGNWLAREESKRDLVDRAVKALDHELGVLDGTEQVRAVTGPPPPAKR